MISWKAITFHRMGEIPEVKEVLQGENVAWKRRGPRTEPCRGGVARRETEKEPSEIEGPHCRSQGNHIQEGAEV